MQKQEKSRKPLVIGIIAAVVILAILLILLLTQCTGGRGDNSSTPATETVSSEAETYQLYWNVDRAEYDGKSEAGLSSRQPEDDGYFHVRLIIDGEEVTVKVADRKLINKLDTMDVFGLEFDENGVVVNVLDLDDMPLEKVGWQFYVQSSATKMLKLNSSESLNGMEVLLELTDKAKIYDMTGLTGEVGCETDPLELDRVYVVQNLDGEVTHVFIYDRPNYMATHEGYCIHCEKDVTWYEWVKTDSLPTVTSGHYQLHTDVQLKGQPAQGEDTKICLDLNGHAVDGKAGSRCYAMFNAGTTLAIMDTSEEQTGTMRAHGTGDQGMVVWVRYGAFYLYSGTLDASDATTRLQGTAVECGSGKYFYMLGGTIIGGTSQARQNENGKWIAGLGGALHIGGKFVMSGGTIQDGYAEAAVVYKNGNPTYYRGLGGNIFLSSSAEFIMDGGTIKGGKAGVCGGNIYADGAASITINDGSIQGGIALGKGKNGGSLFLGGKTVTVMNGGSIYGGSTANEGGNIYLNGSFTMNGGYIGGGVCRDFATGKAKDNKASYNFFNVNGTFTMWGGTIAGGYLAIDTSATDAKQCTVALYGLAKIYGGPNGRNLTLNQGGGNVKVVVGKLYDNAKIGVYATTGIFTNPTKEENEDNFVSDIEGAEVIYYNECLALGRLSCICGSSHGDTVSDAHINGCNGEVLLWAPWTSTSSLPTATGNYYLMSDVTTVSQTTVSAGKDVKVDLNGHDVTLQVRTDYTDGFRLYRADNGAKIAITDTTAEPGTLRTYVPAPGTKFTGKIENKDETYTDDNGKTVKVYYDEATAQEMAEAEWASGNFGMLLWARGGEITVHNAILDGSNLTGDQAGMVIAVGNNTVTNEETGEKTKYQGVVNIYNGTIIGGYVRSDGNISVSAGAVMNIYGGTITGGRANVGGNIDVKGTLNLYGGTITDGWVDRSEELGSDGKGVDGGMGGNINIAAGGVMNMSGGTVSNGSVVGGKKGGGHGGNIHVHGTLNATGGVITGGVCQSAGGNIGSIGANSLINLDGVQVTDGKAGSGGNVSVYVRSNKGLYILGDTVISGGLATGTADSGNGGNISVNLWYNTKDQDQVVVIDGATIVDGQTYGKGGNIYVRNGTSNVFEEQEDGTKKQKRYKVDVDVTMLSGTVTGGVNDAADRTDKTRQNGGSIFLTKNTTFTVEGGSITGGDASDGGGNIYANGLVTVKGGTIAGGTVNGSATGNSNIFIVSGTLNVSGGEIKGDTNLTNTNADECTCNIVISGTPKITKGGVGGLTMGTTKTLVPQITVEGTLNEGSEIWCNNAGYVTHETVEENAQYFHSTMGLTADYITKQVVFGEQYCICGSEEHFGDCEGELLTWLPYANTTITASGSKFNGSFTESGNYYLTGNQSKGQTNINTLDENGDPITVNIDLRGFTWKSADRTFLLQKGCTLGITDTVGGGTILNGGTKLNNCGGLLIQGSKVNLYAGTITMTEDVEGGKKATKGGNVELSGTGAVFNMYGGAITDGYVYRSATETKKADGGVGGNVVVGGYTVFNMYGGTVSGGKAYASNPESVPSSKWGAGGNFYVSNGTLNIFGGTITGGDADSNGNNIYLDYNATVTMSGGKVENTVDGDGQIYLQGGTFNLSGGDVVNAEGVYCRNICTNDNSVVSTNSNKEYTFSYIGSRPTLNITGGTISGGMSKSSGGNIYASAATVINMTGGELKDGASVGGGANIYAAGRNPEDASVIALVKAYNEKFDAEATSEDLSAKITIGGDAKVTGGAISGNGHNGGSLWIGYSNILTVADKAVISGGSTKNCGGNVYVNGRLVMTGGEISGGTAPSTSSSNVFVVNGQLEMSGGVIDGGVNVLDSKAGTRMCQVTLSGKPVINEPNGGLNVIAACDITVGTLEEGASIYTSDIGFVSTETAEANAQYFHSTKGYESLSYNKRVFIGAGHCICGYHTGEHIYGCDGTVYGWAPWTNGESLPTNTGVGDGHWFLDTDVTLEGQVNIQAYQSITLDLNGKTVTGGTDRRVIALRYDDSFLAITDATKDAEGKIVAVGKNGCTDQGVIWAYDGDSKFVLHNGTINASGYILKNEWKAGEDGIFGTNDDVVNEKNGVAVSVNTVTMYGGTIIGGKATKATVTLGDGSTLEEYAPNGGAVRAKNFTMYDGDIIGGTGATYGGAVYVTGTFEMRGGTIDGGTAARGGAVYANNFTMYEGALIQNGKAFYYADIDKSGRGGNVYLTGTGTMYGGTITKGGFDIVDATKDFAYGGNLCVDGSFTMEGGTISEGNAVKTNGGALGGNVMVDGTFIGKGGEITGGDATTGGNIGTNAAAANITLDGVKVTGGEANNGGNIAINVRANKSLTITDKTLISGGIAAYNGGNLYLSIFNQQGQGKILTITLNGKFEGGTAKAGNGGSIFLNNTKQTKSGSTAAKRQDTVVMILDGATVTGGQTSPSSDKEYLGGNIYVSAYCEVTVKGDSLITDGYADQRGGNIWLGGTLNLESGTISNGRTGDCGGNIHVVRGGTLNMSGGKITGGFDRDMKSDGTYTDSVKDNSNVFFVNGSMVMSGGEITGAVCAYGSSVDMTISENAKITTVTAPSGEVFGVTLSSGAPGFDITGELNDEAAIWMNTDGFVTSATSEKNLNNFYSVSNAYNFYYVDAAKIHTDGFGEADANKIFLGQYHCICGSDTDTHLGTCGGTALVWSPSKSTTTLPTASGYWYLTGDVTTGKNEIKSVTSNMNIVLDMNGFDIVTTGDWNRMYNLFADQSTYSIDLTITDTAEEKGTISAKERSGDQGMIIWARQGVYNIHLYNVNIDGTNLKANTNKYGPVIAGAGKTNLYGTTTITGGTADKGTALNVEGSGVLYMDPTVTIDGTIYLSTNGTIDARSLTDASGYKIEAGTDKVITKNNAITDEAKFFTYVSATDEGKAIFLHRGQQYLGSVYCLCGYTKAGTTRTKHADWCTQEQLEWVALPNSTIAYEADFTSDTEVTVTENYYVDGSFTDLAGQHEITDKNFRDNVKFAVNIDLNGYTLNGKDGSRAYRIYNTVTVGITDSSAGDDNVGTGKVLGGGSSSQAGTLLMSGATEKVDDKWPTYPEFGDTVLNIYSGTLSLKAGKKASYGGIMTVGEAVVVNMYGGTITGGVANTEGGNVYIAKNGVFNMYGGTISGGTASINGGNVHVKEGTFKMLAKDEGGTTDALVTGGKVESATATVRGGNICVDKGTLVIRDGAKVTNGTAKISGTTNTKLYAMGGNIYLTGDNAADTVEATIQGTGTEISGGTAIAQCTDNKYNWAPGGNIYINAHAELVIDGGAQVYGGSANDGGASGDGHNLYMTDEKTEIVLGNATVKNTTKNSTNITVEYGTLTIRGASIVNEAEGTCNISTNDSNNSDGTEKAAKIIMTSGSITGGKNSNVYVRENDTFEMSGGTVSGGSAAKGGNVRLGKTADGFGTFKMTGGLVTGGTATEEGANIYSEGKLEIANGSVDGTATTATIDGGVYAASGSTVTVSGTPTVDKGTSAPYSLFLAEGVVMDVAGLTGGKIYVTAAVGDQIATNATPDHRSWILSEVKYGDLAVPVTYRDTNALYLGEADNTYCVCGASKNGGDHDCVTDGEGNFVSGCNGDELVWVNWLDTSLLPTETGNYRLVNGMDLAKTQKPADGATIRIDLNGQTITLEDGEKLYELADNAGVTIIITDTSDAGTGQVILTGTSAAAGGMLDLKTGNTFELYRATLDAADFTTTSDGGVVYVREDATMTVHSGTVIGAKDSNKGGAVYVNGGILNLENGDIKNGFAQYAGGNIFVTGSGSFTMSDGSVINGTAIRNEGGGNIRAVTGATVTVSGGLISGGVVNNDSEYPSANIYCSGRGDGDASLTVTGGEITGGVFLHSYGGDATLYVSGSPVIGGNGVSLAYGNNSTHAYMVVQGELTSGASIVINTENSNLDSLITNGSDAEYVEAALTNGVIVTYSDRANLYYITEELLATIENSTFDATADIGKLYMGQIHCVCGGLITGTNEICDHTVLVWKGVSSIPTAFDNDTSYYVYLTKSITDNSEHRMYAANSHLYVDLNGYSITADKDNTRNFTFRGKTVNNVARVPTGSSITITNTANALNEEGSKFVITASGDQGNLFWTSNANGNFSGNTFRMFNVDVQFDRDTKDGAYGVMGGGAISVAMQTNAYLRNVNFTTTATDAYWYNGYYIQMNNATVSAVDCSFTGAKTAAPTQSEKDAYKTEENKDIPGTYSGGGAIAMSGGSLTLKNCTVSGNSAELQGGGVYVKGGTLTLAGTTAVTGNTVSGSANNIDVASGGTIVLDASFTGSAGISGVEDMVIVTNASIAAAPAKDTLFADDSSNKLADLNDGIILTNSENLIQCECGGQAVNMTDHTCVDEVFAPWTDGENLPTTSGNYYLMTKVELSDVHKLATNQNLKIDLNGYSITQTAANRVFTTLNATGTSLTITDSKASDTVAAGTITVATRTSTDQGGFIWLTGNGNHTVTMYEGTIDGSGWTVLNASTGERNGAVIAIGSTDTFNMYGGEIVGGSTGKPTDLTGKVTWSAHGGAICVSDGGFMNMYGGLIRDGKSGCDGGNLFVIGTATLYGGEITGGTAVENGGNINVLGKGLTVTGTAQITGGVSEKKGGNIFVRTNGAMTMSGGTVSGGVSQQDGGNIYINTNGAMTMSGGTVSGGVSQQDGGNIYINTNGAMTMNGGSITGGIAKNGGNVCLNENATMTMSNGEIKGGWKLKKWTDTTTYEYGDSAFTRANMYSLGNFEMTGGRIYGRVTLNETAATTISGTAQIWDTLNTNNLFISNATVGSNTTIGILEEGAYLVFFTSNTNDEDQVRAVLSADSNVTADNMGDFMTARAYNDKDENGVPKAYPMEIVDGKLYIRDLTQ